jgi:hypothetical protein
MKDDVLLIDRALRAFADIANSLTHRREHNKRESQYSSPLSTPCGYRNTPVDRLCSNRDPNLG